MSGFVELVWPGEKKEDERGKWGDSRRRRFFGFGGGSRDGVMWARTKARVTRAFVLRHNPNLYGKGVPFASDHSLAIFLLLFALVRSLEGEWQAADRAPNRWSECQRRGFGNRFCVYVWRQSQIEWRECHGSSRRWMFPVYGEFVWQVRAIHCGWSARGHFCALSAAVGTALLRPLRWLHSECLLDFLVHACIPGARSSTSQTVIAGVCKNFLPFPLFFVCVQILFWNSTL